MKCKAFKPPAEGESELELLQAKIQKHLTSADCSPPEELVGDILIALTSRHPDPPESLGEDADSDEISYGDMWWTIVHERRWKHLAARMSQFGRLGRPADVQRELREKVLFVVTRALAMRFIQLVTAEAVPAAAEREGDEGENERVPRGAEAGPAAPAEVVAPPAEPVSADEWLAEATQRYDDAIFESEQEDYSAELATNYVFVIAELARRAQSVEFLDVWVARDLVVRCLGRKWDGRTYKPRQLRVVNRHGDEHQMLPGDFFGIRSVTKKIREDQIPKILPSEFKTWNVQPNGRQITLDNIVNRSPPCYQHYDTRRPEIKHRICLFFSVGCERLAVANATAAPGAHRTGADVIGKAFAFELLVNAALKMPHHQIQVDVAWFENRCGKWLGSAFPLRILEVIRFADQTWRNVLTVDRVLPQFFVHFEGGLRTYRHRDVTALNVSPTEHLARLLRSGHYEALFVAGVMRANERRICLPPASLVLPRFDRETPTVLLACAEDDRSELYGATFRDLLSASGGPPLPEADVPDMIQQFLNMIIGPLEQKQWLAKH